MPFYLITSVYDEGVYPEDFRVIEADSRLAVAQNIFQHPYRWKDFLYPARIWEEVRDEQWSPEELLKQIDKTHVDGDSLAQMRIHEIKNIERL
ncbi:MAG TPA: hypothetical protein PLD20_08190 [Blastocatellia bacterium]|nr:hypothetical protein [Blastocatellia bacterium]HMV85254.1 hypothetical protein [Blastocatellia bacterium]HMX25241.1 hypothetical protein [Blastocatellia bacterium]HMY73493.1 hypothetical protein [Blastocatellia bacterium]HMZ17893.1 hypothetical protein [Blastocatellia bacterium]